MFCVGHFGHHSSCIAVLEDQDPPAVGILELSSELDVIRPPEKHDLRRTGQPLANWTLGSQILSSILISKLKSAHTVTILKLKEAFVVQHCP